MAISHLESTDAFDIAIKGAVPTLVKFTADWCGPCKAVAPIIKELASDFEGRMEVLEVDIDNFPDVPKRYAVQGVPTFILFEDGEALAKIVGGRTKAQFIESFEPLL
ncbi:MAG: thioredoxin 1 [Glaciecola sp.]|jgi:thioredoxin 1